MADPFLGEIRLFSLNYAPKGWAQCNGQILSINQNPALYSLLGTTYGGDGKTTFALPDLRGRVPYFNSPFGLAGGEEIHMLTVSEIPTHNHLVTGSSDIASDISPLNNVWANKDNLYKVSGTMTQMNQLSLSAAGGGQTHNNMQPYLAVNFCIAIIGIYPSRS